MNERMNENFFLCESATLSQQPPDIIIACNNDIIMCVTCCELYAFFYVYLTGASQNLFLDKVYDVN